MPRVGDGVLEEIISPPWANGLDIRNARGWRWFELMRLAGADTARLRQIQTARGFKKRVGLLRRSGRGRASGHGMNGVLC
jgi:hypothetical protein